jgi:hypothetical protein
MYSIYATVDRKGDHISLLFNDVVCCESVDIVVIVYLTM